MCEEKRSTGRPQKWTEKQILDAIKGSAGIRATIIKKLNIAYCTLKSYENKYPSVREALYVEEETVLDMAEGNLFKLIQNGDPTAIYYFLNNKGRRRGYGVPSGKFQEQEQQTEERKTGVLVTPGMLSEDAWETQAAKK